MYIKIPAGDRESIMGLLIPEQQYMMWAKHKLRGLKRAIFMSKQIDKTESLEAIDFQRHLLQSTLAFVYMTQFPRKPSVEMHILFPFFTSC